MSSYPESAPPAEPEFFHQWTAPHDALAISINLKLIDRLSLEVMEAFKSIPRRGLEVGGLLLGRIDAADGTVIVEDSACLPSEHLYGPSYSLSPNDRDRLAGLAAEWSAEANPEFHVVGLFRSDTRPEHRFDEQDVALAQAFLPEGRGISLLITPAARGASRAAFGILREGTIEPEGDFPFRCGALQEENCPVVALKMSATAVARREALLLRAAVQPEAEAAPAANWTAFPRRRRLAGSSILPLTATFNNHPVEWRKVARWAWIPIVALTAFLAGAWVRHSPPPAPHAAVAAPAAGRLALRVEHVGRELRLTWKHTGEPIRQATYGALRIRDGEIRSELRLDGDELLTGSLNYLPLSADVRFELQVFAPGGAVTESVRALDAAHGTASAESSDPAEPNPAPRRPSRSYAERRRAAAEPEDPDANAGAEEQAKEATSLPASNPAPPKPTVVQEPAVPVRETPAPAAEASEASPVFTASVEPVGPSRLHKTLGRLSPARLLPWHENAGFVPAKPLHQTAPKMRVQALRRIRGQISTDIRVAIDKNGQVTSAYLETPGDGNPVAEATLAAARNWTFTPALKGSNPVASQAILHFRFQNPEVALADR